MMKTPLERIMSSCKHFNGLLNDKCSKGVCYELEDLPCFADSQNPCACEHRQMPTQDEAQADVDQMERRFENRMKARAEITTYIDNHALNKNSDLTGKMPCPVCDGGTLAWSRASLNGHVWGSCSTDGCVAWME